MAERIGQQFGQYRLSRFLGQGSFGEVYLGAHIYNHTLAAVKVFQARLTTENLKEFINEASTTFRLQHPHIVRLLDFGIGPANMPFLVMAYAANGTLRQRYPKGTRLPLESIITYVSQIASALQHAHDQRLIHRDVKPENILLGPNDEAWLSDFGITSMAHSTRSLDTEKPGGTVPYMAPEQLRGKARPASDQYALGIIVYEWLCGERPFGGTATEIAMQHLLESPPSLREKMPTLLPAMEQVVMTALAKDPEKRFGSVQAFATALEQASRVEQPPSSILSQPITAPSKPLQPQTMISPTILLSQQTIKSSPAEGVQTPLVSLGRSLQPFSSSRLQERPESVRRGISRRAMLLGVAGLVAAGGSLTWLLSSQGKQPSGVSSHSPTVASHASPSPSPTPFPLGTLLYTYRGHSNDVNGGAWSPESKRIASGSLDTTVQVWDAANGGNVFTYRGHSNYVLAVVWSPAGKRIASGSADRTVQVWDATYGGHPYIYRGHSDRAITVAWSPDGKRIASGSADRTVQVWDGTDGVHLYIFRRHSNYVNAVVWSPDGRRIASGSADRTVQVWDAANGGNVFTYRGHSDRVLAVAWSPDGKRIASGGGEVGSDTTVQVWDAANGGNVFTYRGHSDYVNVVAWSPDGKRIASGGGDKTVQVWDATNGSNVFTYRGHSNAVWWLAWSPDGRRIASGGADRTVQVWRAG